VAEPLKSFSHFFIP